ncbi:MAG: hypothetical protein G01um101431_528 [Parcubacteria group bacterium Gr01-1014_31]|nr:MAG: hypothetical protein G01um101431_528 [Parcubacteria group bacterium Gr01-1014_31]
MVVALPSTRKLPATVEEAFTKKPKAVLVGASAVLPKVTCQAPFWPNPEPTPPTSSVPQLNAPAALVSSAEQFTNAGNPSDAVMVAEFPMNKSPVPKRPLGWVVPMTRRPVVVALPSMVSERKVDDAFTINPAAVLVGVSTLAENACHEPGEKIAELKFKLLKYKLPPLTYTSFRPVRSAPSADRIKLVVVARVVETPPVARFSDSVLSNASSCPAVAVDVACNPSTVSELMA